MNTFIVALDPSQKTNGTLEFTSVNAVCVKRPLAMGSDEDAVLIAKNGEIEFSYSPKYSHYWFSKCPDESWFDNFYKVQWRAAENPNFGSYGIFSKAKKFLRPLIKPVKNRFLSRYTNVDAYALDSINLFTILKPYLPDNSSTVLEVGCGPGYKMLPFLMDGHTCLGIEPSHAMSVVANHLGIYTVQSSVLDSAEIRNAFQSADVVFSNHSLEHHWNPRVMIGLAAKYMKPGSAFSVSVPNGQDGFALLQNIFLPHLDCYSIDSLEHLLSSFGFKCVYRSVGAQLRVVAIKGASNAEPIVKRTVFDKDRFRTEYARKFLREIQLHDFDISGDFDVEFRGARPFKGLDVEVSILENALGSGMLRLKGCVQAGPAERDGSALITYKNDSGSLVLMK